MVMAHTAIRIWIPGTCHRVISPIPFGGSNGQANIPEAKGFGSVRRETEYSVRRLTVAPLKSWPHHPTQSLPHQPTSQPAHRSVV